MGVYIFKGRAFSAHMGVYIFKRRAFSKLGEIFSMKIIKNTNFNLNEHEMQKKCVHL